MEIALIVALATAVVLLTFLLAKSRIEMSRRVSDSRREAIKQSRAVLGGRFTEQMTPYLPEFSYDPTEAPLHRQPDRSDRIPRSVPGPSDGNRVHRGQSRQDGETHQEGGAGPRPG